VTILKRLLLLVGVLVLGILVYRVGVSAIVDTLARLAWWQFLLVSLPYGFIAMVDTLGWRFAFARDRAPFCGSSAPVWRARRSTSPPRWARWEARA
jgi:hypothetical protein